jgi:hypothetical protein
VMQQHRQLSCGGNDRSLLAVSSTTLGQLQAPVDKWVYTPYLLNGEPVVVETDIRVTVKLD